MRVPIELKTMTLADGRTVSWAEYGDPAGLPVFYLHGGGACHIEGAWFHREAVAAGIRIVAPDRPSAGRSTPEPGRSILDFAGDAAQLADRLGITRFVVSGNSNGGMFTMGVAFALPGRVIGAAPINSATPIYDPIHRPMVPASLRWLWTLVKYLPRAFLWLGRRARSKGAAAGATPADTEPEVVALVEANLDSVSWQTIQRELELATRPWGFDHRAVPCPVVIFSGESDLSLYYADTWARELRNGRSARLTGGHIPVAPASRRLIVSTWRDLHGRRDESERR